MRIGESYWSDAPERRDQIVLFPTRLDEVVGGSHCVRLLDEILSQLDWSNWEKSYVLHRGQPPIHPRVMASILLYGLMKGVRSSRALEESLSFRLDFRWLAEGRSIDHTTLSKFRQAHTVALRDLFIQVGLVARQMQLLPLEQLAFDGTRLRANNRRSATYSSIELKQCRNELKKRYDTLQERMSAEDARDDALAATADVQNLPEELADVSGRLKRVEAALQELQRVEAAGETVPSRIPLTDCQSRVTPNKNGGFALNYTPEAMVDTQSGFIVACDVIAMTNEEQSLIPLLDLVQQDFGLSSPPAEMLADGMLCNGANLQLLEDRGVTLYSPIKMADPTTNPARRPDLSQPVPQKSWDQLPVASITVDGKKLTQLDKDAFVYDASQDCYWCPTAQALPLATTSTEKLKTGNQVRRRYKSDATKCAMCALRERCLKPGVTIREISRFEHDHLREAAGTGMSTPEAKQKYARRREVAEHPFAIIKQHYGIRQFFLRGLERVRQEWRWITTAFNLHKLINLRSRPGPDIALGVTSPLPNASG
ncbi:MAG: IS1182 family transposase [Planctomycetaceae bacterium]